VVTPPSSETLPWTTSLRDHQLTSMAPSTYIRSIREKIGHSPLLLPSVGAVIFDDQGRVLLQHSSDDGKWHTMGGMIEPNEEPGAAIVREVREETGLDVIPERVSGVYAWPESRYSNGDICLYTSIFFRCRILHGAPRVTDDESLAFQFFDLDALPPLQNIEIKVIRDAVPLSKEAMFSL
jgi:8-oxo-dGTP pyrophosphatase MutT (NUDIX family)